MATKSPKEKVLEFISKNVQKEQDKWMSGMKNNLQEWEDLQNDINLAFNKYQENNVIQYELSCKIARYEQILKRYGITDR